MTGKVWLVGAGPGDVGLLTDVSDIEAAVEAIDAYLQGRRRRAR